VASFSGEGEHHYRRFDRALWSALGEIGVWSILGSGGTFLDLAVAVEALGAEAVAGPIAPTVMGSMLPDLVDVAKLELGGLVVVAADNSSIVPWGMDADAVILLSDDGQSASRGRFADGPAPVEVLGLDRWARGTLVADSAPAAATRASALANLVVAAYSVGAAGRILDITVDYAASRQQFAKPLLAFQTVAHRLAQASVDVDAAGSLAVAAALWLSDSHAAPPVVRQSSAAAARLLATEVGLRVGFLGHQIAGGMGFVDGTLLATLSRRIQEAAQVPPDGQIVRQQVLSLPRLGSASFGS
jgi:alkylation response protein AidB-like acyl-CoA dehydrogenase